MEKLTVNTHEAEKICRDHGWKVSHMRLADGIAEGFYPFGRIVSVGNTGRRTVEIFRKDLLAFLREMGAEV